MGAGTQRWWRDYDAERDEWMRSLDLITWAYIARYLNDDGICILGIKSYVRTDRGGWWPVRP